MKILLIFTLYVISGIVAYSDVIGHTGGSVIIHSRLQWNLDKLKYICKMVRVDCTYIILTDTKLSSVKEGRFILYKDTNGILRVLIRQLKPDDGGKYKIGLGSDRSYSVMLKVLNDDCCSGPRIINTYAGQNITFTCNYPEIYKTQDKYIFKLDDETNVTEVLNTAKPSQSSRFSIYDDRKANAAYVSISGGTKANDGVYFCGVKSNRNPDNYYTFFAEIQLQVTGPPIIISVCISVALLLLIVGLAVIYYKLRRKNIQVTGSSRTLSDNNQVPPASCVYEETKHTKIASASDTGLYGNISSVSNSPDRQICSTIQLDQEQILNYTTVSFSKNPGDATVTFTKQKSAIEYATVHHPTLG